MKRKRTCRAPPRQPNRNSWATGGCVVGRVKHAVRCARGFPCPNPSRDPSRTQTSKSIKSRFPLAFPGRRGKTGSRRADRTANCDHPLPPIGPKQMRPTFLCPHGKRMKIFWDPRAVLDRWRPHEPWPFGRKWALTHTHALARARCGLSFDRAAVPRSSSSVSCCVFCCLLARSLSLWQFGWG